MERLLKNIQQGLALQSSNYVDIKAEDVYLDHLFIALQYVGVLVIYINSFGSFRSEDGNIHTWIPSRPLSEQSQETIEALNKYYF